MVEKSSLPYGYNVYNSYIIKSSKDITEDFVGFLIINNWVDDYHTWLYIWYNDFKNMLTKNPWKHIYGLYHNIYHNEVITYKPRNRNTLKLMQKKFEEMYKKVLEKDPLIFNKVVSV